MFIDNLETIEVRNKKLLINGVELKLLVKYVETLEGRYIDTHRTFVPEYSFEEDWEFIFGTDDLAEDEIDRTWRGRKVHVILDKKTRHPMIYSYFVDNEMRLNFLKKEPADKPLPTD